MVADGPNLGDLLLRTVLPLPSSILLVIQGILHPLLANAVLTTSEGVKYVKNASAVSCMMIMVRASNENLSRRHADHVLILIILRVFNLEEVVFGHLFRRELLALSSKAFKLKIYVLK